MIEHRVDLTINRPVAEVFAFLTESQNHPKWDDSSVAMEPQEPGPWRAGLKFREIRKIGGRPTEIYSQVANLIPNERFDIRSLSGPPFQGHWVFTARDGQTQLQYQAEMH